MRWRRFVALRVGTGLVTLATATRLQPILASRCLHCHYDGPGAIAPFSLETYDDVLIRVNTGQLDAVINHRPGSPQMPRDGPKLPECELSKINKWIQQYYGIST